MTSNSNFPLSAPSAQQQSQEKLSVRKELVRQLSHFINSSDYRFGVMAVTPGGGKTYSTSKVFLEFCDQDPSFIGFLAENTNDRVDEEFKKISDDFYFESVVPMVIRGRTKDLDSPGSCQNHPEAKKIGLSGHSIKRILCQSLCQFRLQCQISGYLSQFDDNGEGGFYLAPYESAINWAANHGIPNIIVFDENPMRPTASALSKRQMTAGTVESMHPVCRGREWSLALFRPACRLDLFRHSSRSKLVIRPGH